MRLKVAVDEVVRQGQRNGTHLRRRAAALLLPGEAAGSSMLLVLLLPPPPSGLDMICQRGSLGLENVQLSARSNLREQGCPAKQETGQATGFDCETSDRLQLTE